MILKKPAKYITYLDKNNLYSYAMSKSLPMCRCEWLDPAIFVLVKCEDDSLRGCLLEVDLEYPNELHELHNNYPLATDILKIKIEMLSNHQLKMLIIIIFLLVKLKKFLQNRKVCGSYN